MIEMWRHHRVIGNVAFFLLVGVFLVLLVAGVQRAGDSASNAASAARSARGTVVAIRAQQKANQSILDSTKRAAHDAARSARLIKSCVNPGGKCHRRSLRQTGRAVGTLNQYIVLSASCTAHIATATHGLAGISQTDLTKLITACVRSQLAIQAQHAR